MRHVHIECTCQQGASKDDVTAMMEGGEYDTAGRHRRGNREHAVVRSIPVCTDCSVVCLQNCGSFLDGGERE